MAITIKCKHQVVVSFFHGKAEDSAPMKTIPRRFPSGDIAIEGVVKCAWVAKIDSSISNQVFSMFIRLCPI